MASKTPSRGNELNAWQRARHKAAVAWFRGARVAQWLVDARGFAEPAMVPHPRGADHLVWSQRVLLAASDGDPVLEAGKRQNVRLVARCLDGRLLVAGEIASFWRMVGRLAPSRGFALGAELRAGCVVPTIGGGVCLVTNALYAMALQLGWRVVERHAHSLAFGDTPAVDATVFWPHVDLRFTPTQATWLSVTCSDEELVIEAYAADAQEARPLVVREERSGTRVRRSILAVVPSGEVLLASDDKRAMEGALGHRNCLNCNEVCEMRPDKVETAPRGKATATMEPA